MPGPDFFNKMHLFVLEVEGVFFNVLLFFRLCLVEIRFIARIIKRWL